jgi:hypothetical protein
MNRVTNHLGIRSTSSAVAAPGRLLGVVLSGTLLLAGCSSGAGGPTPTTVVTTVTQTSTATTSPTVEPPTTQSTTQAESPTSEALGGEDDAGWFSEADNACALAIDEYGSWKAQAGDGAAPEALALGAAAAATHAADAIGAMPRPTSREALSLRVAVVAWAAAYGDLAKAMDSGTYSEVTAAGDAAQSAADRVRSVAGSSAPSCAAMVDEV